METTGETYLGAPVNIFEGVVQTVVRTDGSGEPTALGVESTPGLLEDLPADRAQDISLGWHHFLALSPDAHLNEIGRHAIPKDAPESHGEPFVHTFMYGYVDGELAFLEPMITQEFLASRAEHVSEVATQERYAKPGWYPTRFRVEYRE